MPSESLDNPILTLSVAAKLLKLHPRTLMLYEREGLFFPFRTPTNRRLFSAKNLKELQFIKYLTQKEGVNLKGVRLILQIIDDGSVEGLKLKKRLFPNFKSVSLL